MGALGDVAKSGLPTRLLGRQRMPLVRRDFIGRRHRAGGQPDDDNGEYPIVDGVDDAVVTDADAKAVSPLKPPGSWWTWVVCEQRDGALNAVADLGVELAQGSDGSRAELDAVLAHTQPRSALTCSHGMLGPSSAIAASNAATSSASSSAAMSCS